MISNPFTPTFGTVPLVLAGRDELITRMRTAFSDWQSNPYLSTLLIGPRGSGKTALLSCIANEANQEGWISVDTVAGIGILEDIAQQTYENAAHIISPKNASHISGVELGQVIGIHWEQNPAAPANWRSRMNAILNQLSEHDVGLLITVDEVKPSYQEMIQLVSTYQLFSREGRKVALVMAGLPQHVMALLTNEDVSFLRRARQYHLQRLTDAVVMSAFERTITSAGRTIDADASKYAAQAIHGFPYMLQLVGYFTWEQASNIEHIKQKHVIRGVELAQNDFETGVLQATYQELSAGDKLFLHAMLADDAESRLTDIAERTDKRTGYMSTYKTRLLNQGIIEETLSGNLRISPPFFREYIERIRANQH